MAFLDVLGDVGTGLKEAAPYVWQRISDERKIQAQTESRNAWIQAQKDQTERAAVLREEAAVAAYGRQVEEQIRQEGVLADAAEAQATYQAGRDAVADEQWQQEFDQKANELQSRLDTATDDAARADAKAALEGLTKIKDLRNIPGVEGGPSGQQMALDIQKVISAYENRLNKETEDIARSAYKIEGGEGEQPRLDREQIWKDTLKDHTDVHASWGNYMDTLEQATSAVSGAEGAMQNEALAIAAADVVATLMKRINPNLAIDDPRELTNILSGRGDPDNLSDLEMMLGGGGPAV